MTLFDFIVPLAALAVAGVGILILRAEGRKLDAREPEPPRHPAE